MAKRSKKNRATKAKRKSILITAAAAVITIAFLALVFYPAPKMENIPEAQTQAVKPLRQDAVVTFIKSDDQREIVSINAQIAEAENERMQGMMFRKSIRPDEGMLFIFERPEQRSFWMKNTFVSLDILYIDEDLKIITIHHRTEPLSVASIPSYGKAKYVVEVKGGFCNQYKLEEGDFISIQRNKSFEGN